MAFHKGSSKKVEVPAGNEATLDRTESTQTGNMFGNQQDPNTIRLGFGNNDDFLTMNNTGISEVTKKMVTALEEVYNSVGSKYLPTKISILDKQKYTNLEYSVILVSVKAYDIVAYYVMLLEDTGRRPLTVSQVVDELANDLRNNNRGRSNVYVAAEAINDILIDMANEHLKREYKNLPIYNTDGVVIPYYFTDITAETIGDIAAIAYNACYVEIADKANKFKDIALPDTIDQNTSLQIETNMFPQVYSDVVSRPLRGDWSAGLMVSKNKQRGYSLNMAEGRQMITKVTGYISPIPDNMPVETGMNGQVKTALRFRANIVLDSITVKHNTVGFTLLALCSATSMLNPSMYLAALAPKNNAPYDHGILNIAANLEESPDGGESLDLSSTELDSTAVFDILRRLYAGDSILSMDVELYGAESHYKSIFSTAASPVDSQVREAARKTIVKIANWVTGGIFPSDFDTNLIFVTPGVVIPTGRWVDKDGNVRDIREVDYGFILSKLENGLEDASAWVLSDFAGSGLDSFTTKVNILQKLLPSAEITGKADRLIFNAAFVNLLVDSMSKAGFTPSTDQGVVFANPNNISVIQSVLANAGVEPSRINVFTNNNNFGGNTMNSHRTPYITPGMFRTW